MGRIKVAVSPFFGGKSWVDEYTGIKFEKSTHGLAIYEIPEGYDLTGIKKSLRLNNLMLVEGDPSLNNNVEEVVVPEPTPVVEAPVEEVVLDEQPAEVAVEEIEEPKKKPNKKKAK
jgi:hypothetical protein